MNWRDIPFNIIVGVDEKKERDKQHPAQLPLHMPPPEPPAYEIEEVSGSSDKPERGVAIIDFNID